jgi:hypothetical protein
MQAIKGRYAYTPETRAALERALEQVQGARPIFADQLINEDGTAVKYQTVTLKPRDGGERELLLEALSQVGDVSVETID